MKIETYETGRYFVYTTGEYPTRIGHILKGFNGYYAEAGSVDLGLFKTKKAAGEAIAKANITA